MRRQRVDNQVHRSGLALVSVLWVTVLMMVLVSVAAQTSLLDSRISQIENEKQRCRWACRAGLETAVALLLEDDRSYDGLTDLWADNPQELSDLDFGGVTVTITVTDAASKLNVNIATREQLLFLPDMTEDIADSILDWIDTDDTVRTGGAESGYYLNLPHGYWSRDGAIRTIGELLRVRGVSDGLFYGDTDTELLSADNEGWVKYLTCSSQEINLDSDGNARINVNRANTQALTQQLGLTPGQARWVTENRTFRQLSQLIGQTGTTARTTGQPQQSAQTTQSAPQSSQTTQSTQTTQPQQTTQPTRQTQQQEPPPAEPLDAATVLGMADKITLTGRRYITGKVNVNTADVIVLTALFEGNRELAQNLVAARQGLGGVFLSLTDLQQVEGMTQDNLTTFLDRMTIRSSIFEINATAVSKATGLRYRVEAIVNREVSQGQMTYWREGISR